LRTLEQRIKELENDIKKSKFTLMQDSKSGGRDNNRRLTRERKDKNGINNKKSKSKSRSPSAGLAFDDCSKRHVSEVLQESLNNCKQFHTNASVKYLEDNKNEKNERKVE